MNKNIIIYRSKLETVDVIVGGIFILLLNIVVYFLVPSFLVFLISLILIPILTAFNLKQALVYESNIKFNYPVLKKEIKLRYKQIESCIFSNSGMLTIKNSPTLIFKIKNNKKSYVFSLKNGDDYERLLKFLKQKGIAVKKDNRL